MNMVVSHWSANAVVIVACAVVAAAHLLGMRAVAAGAAQAGRPARAGTAREALVFYLGLLVVVAALMSPVGYFATQHVWVRSVQDLLLGEVAPALIVLGAPWDALAAGLRLRRAGVKDRAVTDGPAGDVGPSVPAAKAAAAWASWPSRRRTWRSWALAATVAANAAWWVWHLPALYDAALRSVWVYGAEVVIYLGLGVAFWLQMVGSGRMSPQFPPLRRVILVAGTVVSTTVLGMVLAFSSGLLYPAYRGLDGSLVGALDDQQLGGAVLWVLSLPPLMITAVVLLARWLHNEESEALAAGLDRLLEPPRSAWPSRPGLR